MNSLQKPFRIHICQDCNYDAKKREPLCWFGLEGVSVQEYLLFCWLP